MDPNACAEVGSVDCPSAGRLLANMLDHGTVNVTYKNVFDFYNRSECLNTNDSISSVVGVYEEWTARAELKNGRLFGVFLHDINNSSKCLVDTCRNLDFVGNADFSGIGVLVSFGIQISIATAFAIFALYRIFDKKSIGAPWESFRNTFQTFFVSSIYINLAIGLAAIITISIEDRTEHTAKFASLGFMLSLASTQALWALYSIHLDVSGKPNDPSMELCNRGPNQSDDDSSSTRPGHVINGVLNKSKPTTTETRLIQLCLGLLWATLFGLCVSIIRTKWETPFELLCLHRLSGRPFADGLLYTPIGIAAIIFICAAVKMKFPGGTDSRQWSWVAPTTVLLGLVLMWLSFGTFWVLRTQLGSVAGKTYRDNDWGFGQVVAVAAWLPTLVDIARDAFEWSKGIWPVNSKASALDSQD